MFCGRLSALVLLTVFILTNGQEEEEASTETPELPDWPVIPETKKDKKRFANIANWCFDEDYENNRYVWFRKGALLQIIQCMYVNVRTLSLNPKLDQVEIDCSLCFDVRDHYKMS